MDLDDLPPRLRRIIRQARADGVTSRSLWWGERPDLTVNLTGMEWTSLEAFTYAGDGA